ncbi:MAG TPA: nuclear transport factor 2 family protein [Solirubrobacteraceae bacterium]|nr:nuclear transport factor 2 family protein [Solirubrobacteraceae bacterium]
MASEPAEIAAAAIGALIAGLRARDLEAALSVFEPDGALFGSESTERAVGLAELRALLEGILSGPWTIGWEWEDGAIVAGRDGDVAWFAAPCVARLVSGDGERTLPYRLSGVLRRGADDGTWRFALFNGAEPAD